MMSYVFQSVLGVVMVICFCLYIPLVAYSGCVDGNDEDNPTKAKSRVGIQCGLHKVTII